MGKSGGILTSLDFDHFKIFLTGTTLGAYPVHGHVFPLGTRRNTLVWRAFFLVVDITADHTHIGFHGQHSPARDRVLADDSAKLVSRKHPSEGMVYTDAAMHDATSSPPTRPIVLCLGGHDPVGGAGIQADNETLAALETHACSAITCLTVQDTRNVQRLEPVSSALFKAQAEAVFADLPVAAIKIGLIGEATFVPTIAALLAKHPTCPVIFDPVLAAGGGTNLASNRLITEIREQLLSKTTLLTPNLAEAQRLSGAQGADDCGEALLALGCQAVLLTGTDSAGDAQQVTHRLYQNGATPQTWQWPRLPHSYHGSGCTLAAACAGLIAHGHPLVDAVYQAQQFTYQALLAGWQPGQYQHLPWRRKQ